MNGEFIPLTNIFKLNQDDYICFTFNNGELLVGYNENKSFIPSWNDVKNLGLEVIESNCIGELNGTKCFSLEVNDKNLLKSDFKFIKLRECGMLISEVLFSIAGRGLQLLNWEKNNKFCGKCGLQINEKLNERAKVCGNCNLTIYPNISPAIIVAVTRGDKILLAHNRAFEDAKYSVLAGFVESGESLEGCVKREVFEEVGIEIKNIKYFNSQSWPFPNSLMIGFFAEHSEGDIMVDGIEIDDAKWFGKDELPNIPEKSTIARKMIDSFIYK